MTKKSIELGHAANGAPVYLPEKYRSTHMHVLGASGRGKSKFLEHLIRQDILNGNGVCVIDPHGTLVEAIVRWCATHDIHKRRKIRLIDPADTRWRVGFNPLAFGPDAVVSVNVDAVAKAFAQVWGGEDTTKTPLLRRVLRAVIHVLVEKKLTLLEAPELITSTDPHGIRHYLTEEISDPIYKAEWEEFNNLNPRDLAEQFASTRNRMLEFLSDELVRTIIGQRIDVLDFRRCMEDGEIVLVNLARKEKLSGDSAKLIGTLMVSDMLHKALARPKDSRPFYLYIDECYHYLNADIEDILDQTRKRGLHAILSHQRLGQLLRAGQHIYNAVMSGAQTKIVFGLEDAADARLMAENIFLGELNLEEPKHALDKPTVVGYDLIWLKSEGKGESYTLASATGHSLTSAVIASESVTDSPDSPNPITTDGSAVVVAEGSSASQSESRTRSSFRARAQTLAPILEVLPTQVYSLDEQLHKAAAVIKNLKERHAVVKLPGAPSAKLIIPSIQDGSASDERVAKWSDRRIDETNFIKPAAEATAEIETRRINLKRDATGDTEGDDDYTDEDLWSNR